MELSDDSCELQAEEQVLLRLQPAVLDAISGAAPGMPAAPECSKICIFERKTVVFDRFAVSSLNGCWLQLCQVS